MIIIGSKWVNVWEEPHPVGGTEQGILTGYVTVRHPSITLGKATLRACLLALFMEITSMTRQWIYNLTSFLFNWLIKVLSLWFYWVRFHPQWTHHAVFKGSLFLHIWQYGFRDWVDRVIYILGIWMLISGFSAAKFISWNKMNVYWNDYDTGIWKDPPRL